MNIRRFVAADMRKVLREVRAALGSDAVILSTKNVDEGVEVIAAVDYDDTLFAEWTDSGRHDEPPAHSRRAAEREDVDRYGSSPERSPMSAYTSIASAVAGDASGREVREDLDERVELSSRPAPVEAPGGAGVAHLRPPQTQPEPAGRAQQPAAELPPQPGMPPSIRGSLGSTT